MEPDSPALPFVTERWLLLLAAVLVIAYTLSPFKFSFPPTELSARTRAITALPTLADTFKLGGHVVWFYVLGGLFSAVYGNALQHCRKWHFILGVAAFCLTLELMQFFAESRHARLTDLFCNFSGLFLGAGGPIRSPCGQAVRAAWAEVCQRHSLRIQKAVLTLGTVIWYCAGLYPATGVLKLGWNRDSQLVVGNETDRNRPWLGEIQHLGIYSQAFAVGQTRLWRQEAAVDEESRLLVEYDFTQGKVNEVIPSGLLASEILALEVPLDIAWSPNGGGILLAKPSLLSTRGPDLKVTEAIMAAGEFSVVAAIRPLHRSQTGPARIVSLSEGIWSRNFTLGQDNSDLVFRVRNEVNGTNGMRHALWIREAMNDAPHEIVAVYDHGVSCIAIDGRQLSPVVDLREPGAYLRLGTGAGGRVIGALLLTLTLALPAALIADSSVLGRWRHLLAGALSFCVGSFPYAMACLWVGGPWRWPHFLWIGAMLLFAYPLCFWYVSGRDSMRFSTKPQ